jgi:transcriptional regulator with XRE-family HTH domain
MRRLPGVDLGERFGNNLARERRAAEFSQEELPSRAAIHRTQISLLESGKRIPKLDTLIKLAGALETSLESLSDGISWTPTVTKPGEFNVVEPRKQRESGK